MADLEKARLVATVLDNMQKDINGKRDLCAIYKEQKGLDEIVEYLAEPFRGKVDLVASPESLGFILGSLIASRLGVGFVPMRNGDSVRLNDEEAISSSYIDHRDMVRSLKMRKGGIRSGNRVLLVDDWIETAATIHACEIITELAEGTVAGFASFGADYNAVTCKMIDDEKLHCVVVKKN